MVLSLVACGNEKHNNSSSEETKVTEEKSDEKIGEDFHADVEAGLLWIDEQGRVTDKDGNVIERKEWHGQSFMLGIRYKL